MIDRYGICTVGEMYKEDCGEWVMYEDAAARIEELEAALEGAAMIAVMKTLTESFMYCTEDTALRALREVAQEIRAALNPDNLKGDD
jgi:hypothetical protein